ncbi:MAG TPA: YdeI/OmpD-associated family protein [Candidatus Saccharimonadales bacterium]
MPKVRFKATVQKPDTAISPLQLVILPKDASAKLPSRGMVNVEGALNDIRFQVVLQPDGQGSHWFVISKALRQASNIDVGDVITLEIEPTKHWPEPVVPKDLKDALAADQQAQALWLGITPMARWDWLNWMGSVKLPKTLRERPEKLCSMLKAGKRRPCCFNRALRMPPKTAELL